MKNSFLPLIPYPQEVEVTGGHFEWCPGLPLYVPADSWQELEIFIKQIPESLRPELQVDSSAGSVIQINFLNSGFDPESYRLEIDYQSISIFYGDQSGLFYALQTLCQLIKGADPVPDGGCLRIPCCVIRDQPRFHWRGFMLDEARHFQGKKTVLELLDWMATFKLNVFHWHLSDDQGWRLEIKNHPELTTVGAVRSATQTGGFLSHKIKPGIHQGFYTQEDIQQIVQYAALRHITIVPEIDLPGHTGAILAAYPHLGCTGGPFQVNPRWGIHKDILCAGNPGTLPFLKSVFAEVMVLFPGQYIHIGGDEAPKNRWQVCPKCRQLAKQSGYSSVEPLQTLLSNQISTYLQQHNRSMMGWNELINENLDPHIAIQFWRGDKKKLISEIRNGRKMVLSNFSAYYLDHSYTHSPLDKVYAYEAIPAGLEERFHKNILGIEAPLWTEFVPNRDRLDWQVFPRLLAVAESAWLSPVKKDYAHFRQRLLSIHKQMDQADIGYAPINAAEPAAIQRLWGPISLFQEGKQVRE